jgi:hypothetical protein
MEMGGRYWTKEETQILRNGLAERASLDELEQLLPKRTRKAITHRIEHLTNSSNTNGAADSDALLTDILAFCRRYDMPETQFGSMALRSPAFIGTLRARRTIQSKTEEAVRAFMAKGNPFPHLSRGQRVAKAYLRVTMKNRAAEVAAANFRSSDPVEIAKTAIRRAGYHCFEAEIIRPSERGKFFIGSRLVTKAELLDFAERRGRK